ncbi:uncharacterized protein N7483_006520 [Penicillium malachiteum]|uniref:uncharacterized protein n=1 Tax=Penicillium malachiteum TaxID=1324776 RepID=UPI002546A1AC|nr:uncharacterized protein N7483_006520 [Penicillium malachiteum]KAJ5725163.1 hypothetical protein N7483_006520 [Penicillium malachiteum]
MGLDPPATTTTTTAAPELRIRRYFRQGTLRNAERTLPKMDPIINTEMVQSKVASNTDCFSRLPLELRLMVACLLPTSDMLHLTLASRAMAPIFRIESFWKSRFELSMERGYLRFLRRENFTKWMMAYHCSKRPARSNEPRRRMTDQWIRYEWARDQYFISPDLAPSTTSTDRSTSLDWKIVKDVNYQATGMNQRWIIHSAKPIRSRESRTQTITVDTSADMLGLAVFVYSEGIWTTITGFELIYGPGKPNVKFGYQLPERQVTIDLKGKSLRGFEVKAGTGCIRAIRPIILHTPEAAYQWIGNPRSHRCWSFRLVVGGRVAALTGEFSVSQRADHC